MFASYIVGAARTPRGRGKREKGALAGIHPQELFAQTLATLKERLGFEPRDVDDVIAGCVSQVGEQGANVARNAVLAAGWPYEVSAVSLNRFCASGLQAIHFGAMGVASGAMDLVIAGGVESMSRVPMGSDGAGQDGDNAHLRERVFQIPQGISADLIATLEGFRREDLDALALRSQRNAAKAMRECRFSKSLFPVRDPFTGQVVLDRDEIPRPDTTAEGLAALNPAFINLGQTVGGPNGETFDELALRVYPEAKVIRHMHTAGNSSGISDGAAGGALASQRFVQERRLSPRARIRAMVTVGIEPVIMLTAPALASEKALHLAGMKPHDIDLWEINEAFASVVLQTTRARIIDSDLVDVNGGAISQRHLVGATCAILLGTGLDELERRDRKSV